MATVARIRCATRLRQCLGVIVVAVSFPAAVAASAAEPQVTARFVAAGDARGRVAGVELTMAPGWHVYWRHPGEAGLATEVELELPAGVTAGELAWPLPVRFDSPGGITSYGYPGRVVLAAPITVVPGAAPEASITAEVAWLACRDVCVLGEARVSGRVADSSPELDLAAWRESLPQQGRPFGLRVTGALEPGARRATPTVWLSFAADAAPDGVELFPMPGPDLKVADLRSSRRGGLVRVDLEAVRLDDDHRPPQLPAVVVVATAGQRRGYLISVPLGRDLDSKGE